MKTKIPSLLSIIGLFFTVIVSPCCFPMFGFVLAGYQPRNPELVLGNNLPTTAF